MVREPSFRSRLPECSPNRTLARTLATKTARRTDRAVSHCLGYCIRSVNRHPPSVPPQLNSRCSQFLRRTYEYLYDFLHCAVDRLVIGSRSISCCRRDDSPSACVGCDFPGIALCSRCENGVASGSCSGRRVSLENRRTYLGCTKRSTNCLLIVE